MILERNALCARIAHDGSMCLLDRVLAWDSDSIVCITGTHNDPNNPLRCTQGLAAVNGIEYAAQAMAVHISLLVLDPKVRSGYLVGVRDVRFSVAWLHDVEGQLTVSAQRLFADDKGMIYQFRLEAGTRDLLYGRITVMLQS